MKSSFVIFALLVIYNGFLWYVVLHEWPTDYFTLAVLNVGQGQALYIESPNHNTLLIDGGTSGSLLLPLRKILPFYDRSLGTLIASTPDDDHVGGFLDLLSLYKVMRVIESGASNPGGAYSEFEHTIHSQGITATIAGRGMVVHLGDALDLTILYPDRDVSTYGANDGAIISKVTYGHVSILLTGTASAQGEEYVLAQDGTSTISSNILELAYYENAKLLTSPRLLAAADPSTILISGTSRAQSIIQKNKATQAFFDTTNVPVLVTGQKGTILFHCTTTSCVQVRY